MSILRASIRWLWRIGLALLVVFLVFLASWAVLPPVSTLMLARWATLKPVDREWTPLSQIAPILPQTVIASEDGQFCRHHGVDWGALREVIDNSGEDGPARGASTIAMQTAKNLFLWPSRSVVRKGVEIPLAMVIDRLWGKHRVMEIYLNIAEWGDGVFGAQAAARKYFGKDVSRLTAREAALLASALPNPMRRNPARPSGLHNRLAGVVQKRAARFPALSNCLN